MKKNIRRVPLCFIQGEFALHIQVSKGLDIPLPHKPEGPLKEAPNLRRFALDLSVFPTIQFKLLVKEGDNVLIGQPLACDKKVPDRVFVSVASGVVRSIERGEKRRLLRIVVEEAEKKYLEHDTAGDLIPFLLKTGFFPHIRQRPCDVLADPNVKPKAIFVNACRSAPYSPSIEAVLRGHETEFQLGLQTLSKIAPVHLVHRKGSTLQMLTKAEGVSTHTVSGPHPSGNTSLHIERISPILSGKDYIWSLSAEDTLRLGRLMQRGIYDPHLTVAVGGQNPGIYDARLGTSFQELTGEQPSGRLIAGDPLMGDQTDEFLTFYANTFSVIAEKNEARELLHFFRLGNKKYTSSRGYLSRAKAFHFDTNQHGEERAFVDGTIYDKVQPLTISTMHLVKALLAEDFDAAVDLGLLEVAPEDFALPTFMCPSKVEMVDIVRRGLDSYYQLYVQ